MRISRTIKQSLLVLLLGALTSIGISWGLSFRTITNRSWRSTDQGFSLEFGNDRDYWLQIYRLERTGAVRIRAKVFKPKSFIDLGEFESPAENLLPSWMSLDTEAKALHDYQRKEIITQASGWPALALSGRFTAVWHNKTDKPIIEHDRTGFLLIPSNGVNTAWPTTWRIIPLNPMWLGFVINTLFYSAIIWLIAFALFKFRKYMRHKHGHCVKCGYDLQSKCSIGCPECGWQRKDNALSAKTMSSANDE